MAALPVGVAMPVAMTVPMTMSMGLCTRVAVVRVVPVMMSKTAHFSLSEPSVAQMPQCSNNRPKALQGISRIGTRKAGLEQSCMS
jgi:hypothetical protein